MIAIDNVVTLDLLRDHIDEIRELSGNDWADLIKHAQPLLLKIADTTDPLQARLLIDELIAVLLKTPANDMVRRLTAEAGGRRPATLAVNRAADRPIDALRLDADARGATTGTAAGLLEWMSPAIDVGYRNVPVLFVTDRKQTGRGNPNKFFSGERGELRYGIAQVSIPDLHRTGQIERPWKLFPESPKRHVTLLNLELSRPVTFLDKVNKALQAANARKVLIFVHGYNVPFADAARSLAQLAFDLNFSGVCILYSWPSTGNFFGYARDEANAAWTRENFLKMLGTLARLQQPAENHLLAHSMGNRVVFQGLQLLEDARFGQVILAAPDEDAGTIANQMPRFLGRAQRNTLYASKKDLALSLSNWVHGYERGGQIGVAGLDSIDASAVNFSQFGHSYFHKQRDLLADIFLLIEHGLPPARRPLIRQAADGMTWLFQP
jgi:esterase/lipase superfamily enzyme